jgi:translation initiation factor IF-3
LGLSTGIHDLEVKAKRARKFLADRNIIKVSLIFKGREMSHKDLGRVKMQEFADMLEDVAEIEGHMRMQGYQMNMILNPRK